MKGIYKIENRINNKVYIGESLDIQKRWELHISELNNKTHHSYKLQKDWNKYGQDNFEFEVIVTLDDKIKKLVDRHITLIYENIYIKQFNSIEEGYNIEDTFTKVMNGDKQVLMVKPKLLNMYMQKVADGLYVEKNGIIASGVYILQDVYRKLHIIPNRKFNNMMFDMGIFAKKPNKYLLNAEYFGEHNIFNNDKCASAKFNHIVYNQLLNKLSELKLT